VYTRVHGTAVTRNSARETFTTTTTRFPSKRQQQQQQQPPAAHVQRRRRRRRRRESRYAFPPPPLAHFAPSVIRSVRTIIIIIIIIISYVRRASRGRVPVRGCWSRTHKLRALFYIHRVADANLRPATARPSDVDARRRPADPIPLYSCR